MAVKEWTKETWPADRWPNFSFAEMCCSATGLCKLDEGLMDSIQAMRKALGPLVITSAYRHETHPVEAAKERPGAHATGKAVDIKCWGDMAHSILTFGLTEGYTGVGISQKGPQEFRFIHFDVITQADNFHAPRPALFSY